ncbi:MAG TPA: TonB-dependent receptor plug domain-containing protein, partial [Parvularculaceae bacterium]|nr:TonB-dependent receptor plug domain-containing protein [Parvularculaceae bacterium]
MKEELKSTGARIRGGFSVLALAAALTAIDGGASMASAQSTEGEPAAEGAADSIYVTASRRKQSVEDVPYNISAISGDDLNAARVTDFSKLTRSIPGLQLTDRGIRDNSTSARLISRGLNTESAAIADLPFVTASPVATYVDETPVFVNLRLNDIERVEFLRGPQGTLYGSGSLGGTLRFIQNKPDASGFSAKAEAGVSFTNDAGGPNYTVSGM